MTRNYLLIHKRFYLLFALFQLSFFSHLFSLHSIPDLSIVGYVMPEDGLGKIPINIIETLGDDLSINILTTDFIPPLKYKIPPRVMSALNNHDKTPGKVALFTEGLWHMGGKNASHMPKSSMLKIAYSMFETTKIPSMWVNILNEEFDAVVVPDPYLVDVYQNSGVTLPIFVLPIPMVLTPYYAQQPHPVRYSKPFVFGDASANKNPGILVEAFAKAFKNDPNVHLVMRAGHLNQTTRNTIQAIINKYRLNYVTLEDDFLSLDQYIQRLLSFDCYVNLSKGEGFSLIPREALALGIPCILSNNTASKTICDSGYVRAVPSNQKIAPLPIYQFLFNEECGHQFNCKVGDVVAALRDVYEHYALYLKKARIGRKWVSQYNYTNAKLQSTYRTLIKPQQVILGESNKVEDGTIITNSNTLLQKYEQLIKSYEEGD